MMEEKRMHLSGTELWLDGGDAERRNGARPISFAVGLQWVAVLCHGCLEDSCCLATPLSPFRCKIRGGDTLVKAPWEEKGMWGTRMGKITTVGTGSW